jgi:quercetin dioxygenase-like cupin family protein
MKVTDYYKVPLEEVKEEAEGVKIRWLISKKDQAENFAMRLFEIAPSGNTPYHTHNWEHEVFVLQGSGEAKIDGKIYPIKKDTVVFIQNNQKHWFKNTGKDLMKFICIIPYK